MAVVISKRDIPGALWDQRRQRILDRATGAFLTHGYEGANLEDIAIAAGISKLTIYRYFTDKADLFEQAVFDAVEQMAEPFSALLDTDAPIGAVLTRFARFYVDRHLQPVAGGCCYYDVARTLIGAAQRHPALARRCTTVFKRDMNEPLIRFFKRRMASGEMRRDIDAAFLAEYLMQGLFFSNAVAIDPDQVKLDMHRRADNALMLFLSGIQAGCMGEFPSEQDVSV